MHEWTWFGDAHVHVGFCFGDIIISLAGFRLHPQEIYAEEDGEFSDDSFSSEYCVVTLFFL